MSTKYEADAIKLVQNVDHVRLRPGMYVGGVNKAGLHHLVWEILDNSIDEVINGHASKIDVILEADGKGITIRDDGRGVPIDIHKATKKPAVEGIFTILGFGGKFGGENYKHSGGLHGVGAAVSNALSERLEVRVTKGGQVHEIAFKRGVVTKPLQVIGKIGRASCRERVSSPV